MVNTKEQESQIYQLLSQIPDPEIPVITIQELGVLRKVEVKAEGIEVTITPTYSGCPAMKQIEDDIKSVLLGNGYQDVIVKMSYSPAWTTDWMPETAKEKLRQFGISPPEHTSMDKSSITGKPKLVPCPRCGSSRSKMISQFGSTACKALYKCEDCLETFDYFKCI